MSARGAIWLLLFGVAIEAYPQEAENSPNATSPAIPTLRIASSTALLQADLYPEFYQSHSAVDDINWVVENSRDLMPFWRQFGDSVLVQLALLSGITWSGTPLDLYLVRYFPTYGSADPLIFPVGGIRRGALVEAVPAGTITQFGIILLLSERLLAQAARPEAFPMARIANHPLMQPVPFRREFLALLLALETARRVMGADSSLAAYESPFWKRQLRGRPLFEQYLNGLWTLTPDKPLLAWLYGAMPDSNLIALTSAPAAAPGPPARPKRQFIEGLPLKGAFGFSTRQSSPTTLVVEKIDSTRLAYACGLREGDIVQLVKGQRVHSQRELMELILDDFENAGAVLQVMRNNKKETVFLRVLPVEATPESEPPEPADSL